MRTWLFSLLWLLLNGCASPRVFQAMDTCWLVSGSPGVMCFDSKGKDYIPTIDQINNLTCFPNFQLKIHEETCRK